MAEKMTVAADYSHGSVANRRCLVCIPPAEDKIQLSPVRKAPNTACMTGEWPAILAGHMMMAYADHSVALRWRAYMQDSLCLGLCRLETSIQKVVHLEG